MKIKQTALVLFLLGVSNYSLAVEPLAFARCRQHTWTPGDVLLIEAQLNKQTHITLPEDGIDVSWGNDELWEQNIIQNHVFVKPRTKLKDGEETTSTVIGASGNTYEFRIVRTDKLQAHCYTIKLGGSLGNKANWEQKNSVAQDQIAALQSKIEELTVANAKASSENQRQIQASVKSYRNSLFSNYSWTKGSGWFAESTVDTVQDDGRFTYIRLKDDKHGIMSIVAEIDGEPEILEKTYDAAKKEYRIAGVYPKFKLRAGESELTIVRKGQ
jgi:type IV secretory pathway VirB9-like protein